MALFVGYIYYQWNESLAEPNDVVERKHVEMVIKTIESGSATLRGALYYELMEFKNNLGPAVSLSGGAYQSVTGSNAADVWGKLPDTAQTRLKAIIKNFWNKFVSQSDKEKGISTAALGKLFKTMGEDVDKDTIVNIFRQFDMDGNGMVDLNEFIMGTTQFLWDNQSKYETAEGHSVKALEKAATVSSDDADEDDEEEEEMPDELADLEPAEQQRRLLSMSLTTMGIGTLLVVLFSDPMTDALGELGNRTGVPPFYVSFGTYCRRLTF